MGKGIEINVSLTSAFQILHICGVCRHRLNAAWLRN
jgi:hypothetical protein